MILPALIDYYDRLAADPEVDIAQMGFSRQKVSFCVSLEPDGSLREIADMRVESVRGKGKPKLIPVSLIVPGQSKSPGSGINPCLLWDNAAYMLGWKDDDNKSERTRKCFEAFREQHLSLRKAIEDEAFEAVCRFFERWNPEVFAPDDSQQEYLSSFGVFRVGSRREFVHQRERVRAWYMASLDEPEDAKAETELVPSLTTGRQSRIARLHEPKIKGVWGAQSAGATLVSFNADAFESYGKSQGENAPVAEEDAFKYCTALNKLLADGSRRTGIGDATVVWWTDSSDADSVDLLSSFFRGDFTEHHDSAEAEDAAEVSRLERAVSEIARGLCPRDLTGIEGNYFVLGLSPNAARLSVRFWWQGPIREMIEHLAQHHQDLHLEPVPDRDVGKPFSIGRVVRETARVHGDRPDMDTVSSMLAGTLARAVLTGGPYPQSLLETVIRRVRDDGRANHARAAIVKACITRHRRLRAGPGGHFEEVPVALNTDGPQAYQLGRLFAVLEKTQTDALGDVGAGVRERYFGSASATPAAVFPRLIRLSQHHLGKLHRGQQVNREKLYQEICSHLDIFPRHLTLEEQGLFQIGYYHQRQDLYTKKDDTPEPAAAEEI